MNLITHNAPAQKQNMVALDRLVKLQKRANTRTLPILSVRTANSDSDKIFEVYFKNKNSTVNYAAKGFNYITALMEALKKYHGFNTQSNGMTNKATVDAKIADNVKRIIDSKFIPAINDAKMVVDSQAKKVYYIFGTFEHFVRVPYTDLIERKDVMGLLFKDFSISPTAKKIENTSSAKVSFSAESREFMPLSVWEKDKLPGSIALTTPDAIRPSAKEYPKEIAALPEFKVDLISIKKDSVYGMSNIINVADGIVSLEFAITLRFAYPMAYAFWAVYAKNNASFSIPNFFNLISGQILGSAGKQRADQSVPRLIPMQTSVDLLQERVSKLNLTQIPRINRNRFTILSDGTVYYIPEDGDLKKYDAVIKASYDVETKKVTPLSKIPEVKDKFLIADWVHNVAVYTNQSGAINTLDLIGAIAFEDRFVMRYFHQKDFKRAFSLDINTFLAMAVEVAKQININIEAIVGNIEGMTGTDIGGNTKSDVAHSDVNSVVIRVLTLTVNYPESTYEDIFTPESEIFKPEMSDNERMYVKVFSQVCNLIYKRLFAVNSHYALLTRMKYALPFYIFGIAAVRVGKYKEIYNKEAALNVKNATSYRSAMDMTVELPNMPGATDGLLPHQAAAYQSTIDKEPKLSVFDINAGGGKCQYGNVTVPTTKGIFTLKELYNCSKNKAISGNTILDNVKVFSSEGIVSATEVYKTKGKTIKITFNEGNSFEGLAEHRYHDGDKFVRLDKIKKGHWFPKENTTNLFANKTKLDIDNALFSEYPKYLTPELARLLGYIVAEGHVSEVHDLIKITMKNHEIQKDIISCLKHVFNYNFAFRNNDVAINVQLQRKYIRSLMKRATSARHVIPMCIRQASKPLQIEFLKALYEGDGCIFDELSAKGVRWKLQYTTISPNLARQVKAMLENMGYNIQLYRQKGYWSRLGNAKTGMNATKRHAYTIHIHFTEIAKFANEIGFISKSKNVPLQKAVKHFAWASTKATQSTNLLALGWVNKAPVGKIVGDALRYLDVLCTQHHRIVAFGSTYRQVQFNIRYLLKHVNWRDTYAYAGKIIEGKNLADNKYTALKFIETIENMHTCDAVSKNILVSIQNNPTIQQFLTQVKNIIKKPWAFVKKVEYKSKVRTVYDLVVPGPNNYVSAGMLSHNTLLIIIDVIKLLNDKKIKRPLILVPARLVSEFISEINKWGQGKINGYPLTSNSVIKLNKYLGYDRNKLLSDIRNAPPNTIFVASYSFLKVADPFKDVTSSKMQYGGTVVSFYPNTQFIRQGGFDLITMDEAHKLKNLSSQVSEATRSVVGDAEYRRIASGTIVYNTANDINGQIALLNPGILSDLDAAITENSVTDANGKIISVNEKLSKVLEDQMKPYVSRMVYRRRDWAFLLPPVTYTFLLCDMTPNLRAYYNKKVDELIEDLMKDPKIAKILESEDQEKIDKLMSSLDSNFAKMEILLNNPESDDVFANLATTKSEDLIPPKSNLVNAIIAAHFNGGTVTDVTGADATFVKSSAKIIVFGYNIAVSKGIYKYLPPEFKAMAVHYSSGNKDALIKFQQDPNIKIFVADETGVGTGFNFTFASHIIRLQSLWTPGAQEQAQSRILRADTKGQYKRDRLYITQIMCRHSLDIAKVARNVSKQVVGLQVTEGERADWKRFENKYNLGPLPQIKMNLKLLKDKGEIRDVGEYFGAYQAIVKWDFEESKDITRGLISALAQKLNIPEDQVTLSMLRDQGRTKFVSNTTLEGTKSVFTPLVPNATILDKFGLGLQPLAIIKPGTDEDEDEDLEDVELEDNVAYAIDDMVVTEFGIGWIRGMRMGRENGPNAGKVTSVNIEIPGFQQYYKNTRNNGYVNLSLLEVFKPTNEDVAARVEARLTKLAEKNRGILFVKDGIAGINVDEILSKTKTPVKTLKPLPIEPKNVGKPKHPGANPNNNTDDDFDINDLIPADRTGKKPVKTVPTPDNTDDEEVPLPKVTRPKDTTTRKIPKEPDEDVTPTKPTRVIVNQLPTPPQLDDKNRVKILNEFVKDPSKLFHYQKQTNTTSVVIDLSIINGEIAMATYPGEENFGKLEEATPATWYKVQPFVFVKIKTLQGAKNLAEKLENNFTLIDGFSDRLIKLAKAMQSKSRPQVEQNQKMDFSSLKNFVILNHTSSKVADALKGYPTVLDGYLYAIFPYPTQSKMANKLLNMRIQQCDKPTLNKTVTGYVFYRNKNKALEALDKIGKRLHIVNYSEVREKLKTDPEFVNFVNR